MSKLAPYAKAVVTFVAAAASFAVPVVDDGLKPSEVLGIFVAGLIGAGVTWAVPNKRPGDAEG